MMCMYPTCNSTEVDVTSREELLKIIKSSIGTKFVKKWYVLLPLTIGFELCVCVCVYP